MDPFPFTLPKNFLENKGQRIERGFTDSKEIKL